MPSSSASSSKVPASASTDVLRATEYVIPSIEIVDARMINPRKIFDTISDNGAAAGIVVGGRPVGPMDVDLRWVGGIMMRNSEIEETGVAAGVLGHPAMGVAWLANKLGAARRRAGAGASGARGLVHARHLGAEGRHRARRFRRAREHFAAVCVRRLAGGLGFEPRLTESESAVLPLNYPPIRDLPEIEPAGAIAKIGMQAN